MRGNDISNEIHRADGARCEASIVFDMVGTKIALQLEGEDAKVMADNLGLVGKDDRDLARQVILNQPPHRAVVRSNHFEPYIQSDIIPFWQKK